jgi:hypothetical protein
MEETHLKTRENIFLINAEEKYIVFDPEEGDKWELNDTGALIVKNLMKGASLEEIKNKILEEYEIDPKSAEKVLQEYVEQLKKVGVIL